MEGTRNERVGILLTSYVIGFITAYIAFGVVQLEDSVQFVQTPNQNMASVINARQATSDDTAAFLAIDKDGLVLIKDNVRTLLSATVAQDSVNTLSDGAHVAIADYSMSPDSSQVYFCELPSEDSDSCRPYIYSVDEGIVYPVTVDNERIAFEAEGHHASWSDEGDLLVN